MLGIQRLERLVRFGDITLKTAAIVGAAVFGLFVIGIQLFFAMTDGAKDK